jgi:restriction system protein
MIPDYQTLMLPVLRSSAEGERRVADVVNPIADEFKLSESERDELLPSGRQRILHNRIHWAKFYMSKAGLIASPGRGRWQATEAGRALLATHPAKITVETLLQYPSFREFYDASRVAPGTTTRLAHPN